MTVSKFITANGLRLHYLDYGGEESPIVCIHGLSRNAHDFDALAGHLRRTHRVFSLDVRGRGESEWGPPADYTIPNYAGDLGSILDQLELRKVTLIGTSMGGIISIVYAGGHPDRVEKLVLNDIGPDIDPAGAKRIGAVTSEAPTEFANMSEVVAYLRQHYPSFARANDQEAIESAKWSVKPTPDGRFTWRMDPAVRRGMRTAVRPLDLWVPYTRITAPILVVRGAASDVLSTATAQQMCRVLKNVRLIEVPGVGHAPSLVEPEALGAIQEFLQSAN